MGIRSLLIPVAHITAVTLNKAKIPISSIVGFSFLVIFFTIFTFYIAASSFYSKWFMISTIVGIFLTGFLDEVIRELSKIKKLPALPLILARHSDLLLVFGILYVATLQPYGLIPWLNIGENIYLAIGISMSCGVLVADLIARKMGKRDPGLESRAERMFLLTAFLLVGFYFNEFLLAIFIGLLCITLLLYLWILRTKLKFRRIKVPSGDRLLKLYERILAGGALIHKIKLPVRKKDEKEAVAEENFEEPDTEEYDPTPGYNFTAVVNDKRSDPIPNVMISLSNVETGDSYSGYTDSSGRASFTGVAEGQYDITLECREYKTLDIERYVSMDSGEVFTLKRPFSDLSIVISDKKRTTPVPNARVLLKAPGKEAQTVTRNADNLGVAYFDELDVGAYEVRVTVAGYDDWKRTINLEEENVVSVNLERGAPRAEPVETEAPEPPVEKDTEASREEVNLSETLAESMLFEYSLPEDVRNVVSQMVSEYKKHGKDVFLVSTAERTAGYLELSAEIIDFDPTKSDVAQFKNVLERMPAGSVLIFEPLSKLILTIGFETSLKFISTTLKYMTEEGLSLTCFLNPSAHDEKEVEKLRELLGSVAIEGNKIFR